MHCLKQRILRLVPASGISLHDLFLKLARVYRKDHSFNLYEEGVAALWDLRAANQIWLCSGRLFKTREN